MNYKASLSVLGMTTLLTLGFTHSVLAKDCNPCAAPLPPPKPVVKNDCNPCAVPPPPPKPVTNTCATCVTYHPVKSGQFHERLVPKDADGKPLACLDISGSSVKVGVDWTTSSNDVFTWGTHTTKYNSATVAEERYQ
ncbi:MAG: hypothetical protein R3E93_01320 [Thiothrix sp.]